MIFAKSSFHGLEGLWMYHKTVTRSRLFWYLSEESGKWRHSRQNMWHRIRLKLANTFKNVPWHIRKSTVTHEGNVCKQTDGENPYLRKREKIFKRTSWNSVPLYKRGICSADSNYFSSWMATLPHDQSAARANNKVCDATGKKEIPRSPIIPCENDQDGIQCVKDQRTSTTGVLENIPRLRAPYNMRSRRTSACVVALQEADISERRTAIDPLDG